MNDYLEIQCQLRANVVETDNHRQPDRRVHIDDLNFHNYLRREVVLNKDEFDRSIEQHMSSLLP